MGSLPRPRPELDYRPSNSPSPFQIVGVPLRTQVLPVVRQVSLWSLIDEHLTEDGAEQPRSTLTDA